LIGEGKTGGAAPPPLALPQTFTPSPWWRGIASQAISVSRRDPEPITIIGHSLGGDAAVKFAERLDAAGIPVSLLVTYDPTRFTHNVPPNVERYVNLYQSSNILGGGGDVVQGRGFH